jgi:transposase
VVHVKSEEAQQIRMLLVNRNLLLGKLQDIENSVRGSLKVFGLRLGRVTKRSFEARIRELVEGHASLAAITEPLLRVRRVLLDEFCHLDRMAIRTARNDAVCRCLMTVKCRRRCSPAPTR